MITPDADEDDLDSLLLAHNPRFIQLLEEARRRVQISGGVSLTDFRLQLQAGDEHAQDGESENPQ